MEPKKRNSPVRFRLSPVGWMFLLVALTVGLAAGKTQAPMLYVIFGAMLAALISSALMSRQMIVSVELRRDAGDRVWQNQVVHLSYYLRNVRHQGAALGISVEELSGGIQSVSGYCVHLPARKTFRAGARFICRRRGRTTLGNSVISTTFPFGLIKAYRRVRQQAEVVVWPARGSLRRQLLVGGAVQVSSAAPSPSSGGQDEFFGLRDYRSDDNPRWIHWRKTASRGTAVVREMARPLPDVLYVVVDVPRLTTRDTRDAGVEVMERGLRLAATLVNRAMSRDYQVGLALSTAGRAKAFATSTGRGHRCDLLDALADVDAAAAHPLAEVLAVLPRGALMQAQVVLVTTRKAADVPEAGAMARACRHLTIVDPAAMGEVFEDQPLAQTPEPGAAVGRASHEQEAAPADAPPAGAGEATT